MALSLLWYQEQHAVFVRIPCSENSKKIFWYWSFGGYFYDYYYYFVIKVMTFFRAGEIAIVRHIWRFIRLCPAFRCMVGILVRDKSDTSVEPPWTDVTHG